MDRRDLPSAVATRASRRSNSGGDMQAQTADPPKVCVGCGKNVAGSVRMKDADGRYWCPECGELEQRRTRLSQSGLCAGCGESFPPSKLTEIARLPFCDACLRLRPPEIHQKKAKKGSFFRSRREKVLAFVILTCIAVLVIYKLC